MKKTTISIVAALSIFTISIVDAEENKTAMQQVDSKTIADKINEQNARAEKLKNFLNNVMFKGSEVKVVNVVPTETKPLKDNKEWDALFTIIEVEMKGQRIVQPMTFLVNGEIIAERAFNMKTGEDYAFTMKPTLPKDIYSKGKLIAGKETAKQKIVLFSDPLCPFCRDLFPDLLKAAQTYPDQIALYHYSKPLEHLHRSSKFISQAIEYMRMKGDNDFILRAYNADIENDASPEEAYYELFTNGGDSNTTYDEIVKNQEIIAGSKIDSDIALRSGVQGTPTVFINGEFANIVGLVDRVVAEAKKDTSK